MARFTLFAVAAAAFGALGANAGLCRPSTTTAVAESSTTAVAESSTTLAATSTTALAESSTTILAASTTTTEGPSCIESQVVVNPGFEDDANGAPWSGAGLTTENPRTGSYNVHYGFNSGGGQSKTLTQTLHNLEGNFDLQYYYSLARARPYSGVELGFFCTIVATVGGREVSRVDVEGGGWSSSSRVWANPSPGGVVDEAELKFVISCIGDFEEIVVAIDDITFTRACRPLQT
ncbi:hypothetical protein ACJ41O_010913 [Fusarium nematophilum]